MNSIMEIKKSIPEDIKQMLVERERLLAERGERRRMDEMIWKELILGVGAWLFGEDKQKTRAMWDLVGRTVRNMLAGEVRNMVTIVVESKTSPHDKTDIMRYLFGEKRDVTIYIESRNRLARQYTSGKDYNMAEILIELICREKSREEAVQYVNETIFPEIHYQDAMQGAMFCSALAWGEFYRQMIQKEGLETKAVEYDEEHQELDWWEGRGGDASVGEEARFQGKRPRWIEGKLAKECNIVWKAVLMAMAYAGEVPMDIYETIEDANAWIEDITLPAVAKGFGGKFTPEQLSTWEWTRGVAWENERISIPLLDTSKEVYQRPNWAGDCRELFAHVKGNAELEENAKKLYKRLDLSTKHARKRQKPLSEEQIDYLKSEWRQRVANAIVNDEIRKTASATRGTAFEKILTMTQNPNTKMMVLAELESQLNKMREASGEEMAAEREKLKTNEALAREWEQKIKQELQAALASPQAAYGVNPSKDTTQPAETRHGEA